MIVKTLKVLAITLLLSINLLFSANAKDTKADNDTLIVGCEAAFAPFTYTDDKGNLVGFDLDLIRALGKQIGYKNVKIVSYPFDGLIPALMTDNIDLIISGFTISKERAQKVDFSDPYYLCGLTFLTDIKNIKTLNDINDLDGKDLCVQIGTTGALYVQKRLPNAHLKTFNSPPDTYLELQNGGCVAVINDKPVNDFFLASSKKKNIISKRLTTEDKEYYGIAVNKGNKVLLDKINNGLKELKANGKFKEISVHWFGYDITDDLK